MSTGSIIELISKGELNNDLSSCNSSLFNYNFDYQKKKNYAKYDTIYYPNGRANWGNTVRFNIDKKGDLLYGLYLVIKLPKLSISELNITPPLNEYDTSSIYRIKYADFIGSVVIDKISLYINDLLIDEQYGDYIQVYTDLYMSDCNRKKMLGFDDILNRPNLKIDSEYIYIPFKFWFCLDNFMPLPIIALKNSDIYIDITFKKFNNCISVLQYNKSLTKLFHSNITHKELPFLETYLKASFYIVDSNERFILANQEYTIPILQSQVRSININSNAFLDLTFNKVIKDIIFFIQPINNKYNGEYFNFSAKTNYIPYELYNSNIDFKLWDLEPKKHLLSRARLLFDGIERIEWQDYKYFYLMHNHENYRTNIHSYIYAYSFTSNPVRNTNLIGCDFSKINNIQLQIEINSNPFILNHLLNIKYPSDNMYEFKCYATNYNILIIKNGLVGIKYNI